MRNVVISLRRATERRERMAREFAAVGLNYEIFDAVDGENLSPSDLALVDNEARRRLGLRQANNRELACWISHTTVMRELVQSGAEMMAVFEDDARLSRNLPMVLRALEPKPFSFDLVSLERRRPQARFVPVHTVVEGGYTAGFSAGRTDDKGSSGYVITRATAERFLMNTPVLVLAIDLALKRFWESRLNVFWIDPPVVHHDNEAASFINLPGQEKMPQLGSFAWARKFIYRRRSAILKRLYLRKI